MQGQNSTPWLHYAIAAVQTLAANVASSARWQCLHWHLFVNGDTSIKSMVNLALLNMKNRIFLLNFSKLVA